MRRGWLRLWRKAGDSLIGQAGRFQLFSWLLVTAAHEPIRQVCTWDDSYAAELEPGQLVLSTRVVAQKLRRTKSSVQRDLAWMVRQKMVATRTLEWGTLVTILNWSLYQPDGPTITTAKADAAFVEAVRVDLNTVLADHGVARKVTGGKTFAKLVSDRVAVHGATLEEFRHVHRVKAAEWVGTEQETFLRPSTLYAPSHWEDYRDQPAIRGNGGDWKPSSAPARGASGPRIPSVVRQGSRTPDRPSQRPTGDIRPVGELFKDGEDGDR